MTANQTL